MCGLVYAQHQASNKLAVWQQYEKQKNRGTQGFGLFDGKQVVKAATEKRIKRWFKRTSNNPDVLMFHHRFPTSTENVKRAAHPFHTGDYFGKNRYTLIHNGVIRNATSLKVAHEKRGITYSSTLTDGKFNDSEALLWDFALYMEGVQDELKAFGDIAFICIKQTDKELDKLLFGRNYFRPLNLKRENKSIFLSSEGEGEEVPSNELHTYNYATNRITKKFLRIPTYDASWQSNYGAAKSKTNHYDYYDDGELLPYSSQWEQDYYGDTSYGREYKHYSTKSEQCKLPGELLGTGKRHTVISDLLAHNDPTEAEINIEFYTLLDGCNGEFKTAYEQSILEYGFLEDLEEDGVELNLKEQRTKKILEATIELLENSSEWTRDDSIHPMWIAGDDSVEELTATATSLALSYTKGPLAC